MEARRTYTMRARAESVERTREDILAAARALTEERASFTVGLADVAALAGVTMRTILRHFGNREGLFDALSEHMRGLVEEERATPVGDLPEAVRTIVAHYEKRGNLVLRMLEEEALDPQLAETVAAGRHMHRDWVRTVFAPYLEAALDPSALEDLLVVATDVYTWKLLRLDAGHTRKQTEERVLTMIRRLAEGGQ